MSTVNVNDLIDQIRTRCDIPYPATTTPITLAWVERELSSSAFRLSGLLCDWLGEDRFTTLANLVTAIGASNVPLPDDFRSLKRVDWVRTPTEVIPLERATVDDWDADPTVVSWQPGVMCGRGPIYRILANDLVFWPLPDQIYNLRVYYVSRIPDLTAGGYFSCGDGWDEWLVLDVCAKVRVRQKQDNSDMLQAKAEVQAGIQSCAPRDQWKTAQVRDTRGALSDRRMLRRRGNWGNWQ